MKRKQAKPKKVKGAMKPKFQNELARKHGMSYGKYVANCEGRRYG